LGQFWPLELSIIFGSSWGSIENWHEFKTEPPSGLIFINVLRTAFTCRSQKRKKNQWLNYIFTLLGSPSVKAVRKMLVTLTLGNLVCPNPRNVLLNEKFDFFCDAISRNYFFWARHAKQFYLDHFDEPIIKFSFFLIRSGFKVKDKTGVKMVNIFSSFC